MAHKALKEQIDAANAQIEAARQAEPRETEPLEEETPEVEAQAEPAPEPVVEPSEDWKKRFTSLKTHHDRSIHEERQQKEAAQERERKLEAQVKSLTEKVEQLSRDQSRPSLDTSELSQEFGNESSLIKTVKAQMELITDLRDRLDRQEQTVNTKLSKVDELAQNVNHVSKGYENLTYEQFVSSVLAEGAKADIPISKYDNLDEFLEWLENTTPAESSDTYKQVLEKNKTRRDVAKTVAIFSAFHARKTGSAKTPKAKPDRASSGQAPTQDSTPPAVTQQEWANWKNPMFGQKHPTEYRRIDDKINSAIRDGTLPAYCK